MIENSDRGITLNKGLAWTMLVGLLGGGYWVGTTISDMSGNLRSTGAVLEHLSLEGSDRERRIRTLENSLSRADERQNANGALLSRIDGRLERLEQALLGRAP